MNRVQEIVEEVADRGPEKVFIQVPEGLKPKLEEIQSKLEGRGVKSIASLEPCYGACDLKDVEAKRSGCDLLLHIGHSKFCRGEEIEALYYPWYYDLDPVPILEENLQKLGNCENVGLVAPVNFLEALKRAEKFIEDQGKIIYMSEGDRTKKGQILGCDLSSALKVEENVNCYLCIGSGRFHPLGLALKTEKPVYILDFEEENIYAPDFEKFARQRVVAMEEARDAERFAVLLSWKKGQANPGKADELKEALERSGKGARIFSMDEITPGKLEGIKVDCLVNTACPRIAIEHRTDFSVPILNPDELDKIL